MNNPQQVKKYGKKRSGAPDDVRRAPMRDRTNTFDSLELMATSPTRKRSVDEHDIVASASFTTRRQFAPDFATNIPSMTSQRNKIKKPNAIEDHLTGAPLDHITLLVKQIKAAESRKSQFQDPDYFSMLLNDIPQDYPQLLRSFGFDESVAGDHIKYSIPLSQVDTLVIYF